MVVDCRPAIRSYLSDSSRKLTPQVRRLVRGHWRRVAHGPQAALRRFQHIAPYWKGPEEAEVFGSEYKIKNPQ